VKPAGRLFPPRRSQLKPLTLRAVAEAIGMHESTVSRVTSNKYLQLRRAGPFELKYFFTSGVAAGPMAKAAVRPRRSRPRSAS
jgi:RNA polymerase sigma-54 factor